MPICLGPLPGDEICIGDSIHSARNCAGYEFLNDECDRPGRTRERQKERARAAGSVLRSFSNAGIWLIAGSMLLGQFGLDLGPLVASAGVVGVALGLGAQTIVRDVLSGLFMLVEDQYGVGDEVEVQDVKGIVESVGLRITTVRDTSGTLWYLRNGEILKVGNKSKTKKYK
ncbi:MAG: small-conductance mechanosensitive channel [Actinobacteria bacterium]|nr:small-conductance mechanosensitive channel [Actinomycetota bacterium]